jgi:hypothetical protein
MWEKDNRIKNHAMDKTIKTEMCINLHGSKNVCVFFGGCTGREHILSFVWKKTEVIALSRSSCFGSKLEEK